MSFEDIFIAMYDMQGSSDRREFCGVSQEKLIG